MANGTLIIEDQMDPARAQALAATLDLPDPKGVVIPFGHQVYFWDPHRAEKLGRDGHPRLGGFLPDLGLPRRMWAGGELRFHRRLLLGTPATRTSVIESVERKEGNSGPLAFVRVHHAVSQGGEICVEEWQDLVYRQDPGPDTPPVRAHQAPEGDGTERQFSTTQLFRYSALTFNGHRIHYDRDYAREVEGYTGLVVHGPLLAQTLMLRAEAVLGKLSHFSFRATSPLMDFETARFCHVDTGDGLDLWVRGPDGRQCLRAAAS